jgi:hypothetical protein
MSLETPIKIRMLQRKLYQKAKEEPDYRFYLLYDKIYREDILNPAYALAKPIRDRVVQTAAKLVLEPIFEADFDPNAYGYRPKRSAQDAIRKVQELLRRDSQPPQGCRGAGLDAGCEESDRINSERSENPHTAGYSTFWDIRSGRIAFARMALCISE